MDRCVYDQPADPASADGTIPTIILFSPSVGNHDHASGCSIPLAEALARNDAFRPILVTGSQAKVGTNSFVHVKLPVDYSVEDAARYRRFGRLAPLIRGLSRVLLGWKSHVALGRYLSEAPPTALVHFLEYEQISLCAWILFRQLRQPYVITVYQADYDRSVGDLRAYYKRLCYACFRRVLLRSRGVIVYGEYTKKHLQAQMAFEADTPTIRAVRLHPMANATRLPKAEARRLLGIPPGAHVLLVFGVLRRNKNIDQVIEACAKSAHRPFLLIAGQPTELEAHEVRGWLRASMSEDRYRFDSHWASEQEIAAYFSAADLYVSAYAGDYVGQSGPVNICRSFELPCVVTDAGELGDYVKSTGVGIAVRPDDLGALAGTIDAFFSDRSLRQKLEDGVLEAAMEYGWDYFARSLESCYEAAVHSGPQNG